MATILSEVRANNLLAVTLHGVREVLEQELEVSPILIATDETIKGDYMREGHTTYPYAHLELTEVMAVRDQTSNRTMQRQGFHSGLDGATKATTRRGYLFPVTIGMTLKYATGDPMQQLDVAQALCIMACTQAMAFRIRLDKDFSYIVRIEVPEQTAIALASTTDTSLPGGAEVEAPLVIHSFIGFFRNVAAVNSGRPTFDIQIETGPQIFDEDE